MKRVATTAFIESMDNEEIATVTLVNLTTEKLKVAKHTEELRVIDVEIHGIKVIAMVDNSSQIISIRQDIWE